MRVIKKGDRAHVEINEPVLIKVNNRRIPVVLTHYYSCRFCPINGVTTEEGFLTICLEWVDCMYNSHKGLRMVPIEDAVE